MQESSLLVDVALIHFPVVNRNSEIIGSAVTNLDLHDIARAGRTYGVSTYWVVTPYEEQQQLATQIVEHWTGGYGGEANPDRRNALSIVRIKSALEDVIASSTEKFGTRPLVVGTCAKPQSATLGYDELRKRIWQGTPILLLFGTAWGLAPEALAMADTNLPPLKGPGTFNHLSVRSAASIIMDRLLGVTSEEGT